MLSTTKIKKIINTDYNELLSRIINKKSSKFIDVEANNRKICYELFQKVIQKNKHNFKFEKVINNDSLNFFNDIGEFKLYIFEYNRKDITIRFTITPYEINTNEKGEFIFSFKSWVKAAQFLIKEKNKYLKMISEFIHLKKDEYFILAKSNSKLKNFEVYLEDVYDRTLELIPIKKSVYFGT